MITFLSFLKRAFRVLKFFVVGFAFVFFASVLSVDFLHPKLATYPLLAKMRFFQDEEKKGVTIINNKEEVVIREDDTYPDVMLRSRGSFVRVIGVLDNASDRSTRRIDGTGIILTNDGLVVADAALAIGGGAKHTILDSSGKQRAAIHLGTDDFLRLAFFKAEGNDFSAIPISNSDDVRVGKRVLSVGYSRTSSDLTARALLIHQRADYFNVADGPFASADSLEGVFLTDKYLVKGEEGSAVLDLRGELVGIMGNRTVDGETLWYVTPANEVRRMMEMVSVLESDRKREPFGAYYVTLNPFVSKEYGLDVESGAWISLPGAKQASAVLSGSPASRIGLKTGDVVLSVSGVAIDSSHPFSNLLYGRRDADSIDIEVLRSGKRIRLSGPWGADSGQGSSATKR